MSVSVKIGEVSVHENHQEKYARRKRYRRPRIHPWIKNYNPILDITEGERYNKPHQDIRPHLKEILAEAIRQAPEGVFRMDGEQEPKFRWSQYAGCSCPCSPGFIITNMMSYYTIHVDYEYVEEKADAMVTAEVSS